MELLTQNKMLLQKNSSTKFSTCAMYKLQQPTHLYVQYFVGIGDLF